MIFKKRNKGIVVLIIIIVCLVVLIPIGLLAKNVMRDGRKHKEYYDELQQNINGTSDKSEKLQDDSIDDSGKSDGVDNYGDIEEYKSDNEKLKDMLSDVKPDYAKPGDSSLTVEQENIIKSVDNYLSIIPFSKEGLKNQLITYERYSADEVEYVVEELDLDWTEMAIRCAENYLDLMSFSKERLKEQLVTYDKFTDEEAEYAAEYVYHQSID